MKTRHFRCAVSSRASSRPGTWTHDILQLTDWLAHVPKEVLAKNFQTDISAFDEIPGKELYIFPSGTCRCIG